MVVERVAPQRSPTSRRSRTTDALLIGLVQAIAIIPGVSRSAATIVGGSLIGDRASARSSSSRSCSPCRRCSPRAARAAQESTRRSPRAELAARRRVRRQLRSRRSSRSSRSSATSRSATSRRLRLVSHRARRSCTSLSSAADSERARIERYDGMSGDELALAARRSSCRRVRRGRLDARRRARARGGRAPAGTLVWPTRRRPGADDGPRLALGARRGHLAHADRAAARRRALDVLSLRVGLALRRRSTRSPTSACGSSGRTISTCGDRKLAGILIEARWRDGRPSGSRSASGINVRAAARVSQRATGLRTGVARVDVLAAIVPAIRARPQRRRAARRRRSWRRSPRAISPSAARVVEPVRGRRARHRCERQPCSST